MNRLSLWQYSSLLAIASAISGQASAYEDRVHQQLTFIAARQFNECVQGQTEGERLSALDTRYIVKSNVALANTNIFVRMFRWNYYNRNDQTSRSTWGVIDTRFHERFDQLVKDTGSSNDRYQRLQNLGRIIHYVQDMTSPAHVVPVYTGRWWRFTLTDKFDRFRVDAQRLEDALRDNCEPVNLSAASFHEVLRRVADDTIAAVRAPIHGFPSTWEAYWQFADDPDDFGEYGAAGNSFGERTEFRCGADERCLLLRADPLYKEFAARQHLLAVLGTMNAIALLHQDETEPDMTLRAGSR